MWFFIYKKLCFTIIYWYERISSGIVVKHIEIDEQDKEAGLTLESGVLLEEENISGKAGLKEIINRKVYENYENANGPISGEANIIIVPNTENAKEVTFLPDNSVEVI